MAYAAVAGSPNTTLAADIAASDTTITLTDASIFTGMPLPNLLTIGYNRASFETVEVTAINGNEITVVRAKEGAAIAWTSGVEIARVFTALDWNNMIAEKADADDVPSATTTTPKMDGTAAVGSETNYAKGDHVHPTDTGRQAKITASGILKGDGTGGVSAATAGTDYVVPSALNNYVPTSDKGAASGISSLDSDTKVTPTQASAKIVDLSGTSLTLGNTHDNRLIRCTSSSAVTITIASGLNNDMEVEIMKFGTGNVTISAGTGVTLYSAGANNRIETQYTSAVLKHIGSNVWVLQGAVT